MPTGDPYPKVKRRLVSGLKESLAQYGFEQFGQTVYFIRDRNSVRDVIFFQKMRSTSVCFCYGMSLPLPDNDWQPGAKYGRWLEDQAFYSCRYVDRIEGVVAKIVDAVEREALPWFDQFQAAQDV